MSNEKLTKETILIAKYQNSFLGHYTKGEEYKIKKLYGHNDSSCIVVDDKGKEDHFFTSNILDWFTIKTK